jgi:hypothetical protein
MTIVVFNPVGDVERLEKKHERALGELEGKRIGYIFNQHTSALAFWKAFEAEVGARYTPASVHRIYKTNTWAQAPKSEIERLADATDFAVIGVGA